jgi:hypothetical protein
MKVVSVVGQGHADDILNNIAEKVGSLVSFFDCVLLTGGLGGVMEFASKGAKSKEGIVAGIVPGYDKCEANRYVDIVIPSGMGHARNVLVVSSGDLLVSVGGSYGTASEVAIALKLNKNVISFASPVDHEKNFVKEDIFFNKLEFSLRSL